MLQQASSRPKMNDAALPSRRPHQSLTEGPFFLPPCSKKVTLGAQGPQPPPCLGGASCRRCKPLSRRFVPSTHLSVEAEPSTQAFTADGMADFRSMQDSVNTHKCCFTCWKYRKAGAACVCRFHFPLELSDTSSFAVERSQQTGRCARSFRPRRNHPWINATSPIISVRPSSPSFLW